jgi:uncharacterized damage-inducible protein DinB
MKRRTLIHGLAAAGAAPLAGGSSGWSNGFAEQLRDDLLGHWRSTKEYSLDVLEAMPAEHFDFKPVEEQRTFAEQLEHFANSNAGYFSRFEKSVGQPKPSRPQALTKETLRDFLTASFDYVDAVLSSLTEKEFLRRDVRFGSSPKAHTAQDIFLRAYMHTAHHRGQIITYLRIKGITPPRWRFPPNGDA